MSFFGGGYQNPAKSAQGYYSQIPGAVNQYYDPFFQAGKGALPNLQGQYDQLLNDPGGKLNQFGMGFHESPGFQFALKQALQGSNHAAAAGGFAGSPENQERNIGLATQYANQDYNNYLDRAGGLYGQGLRGEQDLSHQGQQAGAGLADQISQALAQQGNLSYAGQQNENQHNASNWQNAFDIAGGLGAFFGGGIPRGGISRGGY